MGNCQNPTRYVRQTQNRQQRQVRSGYPGYGNNTADRNMSDRGCERYETVSGCGCNPCKNEDPLYGLPLAMAYVPWQSWREIYKECKALCVGTIFEELDKPFRGRGGCNR